MNDMRAAIVGGGAMGAALAAEATLGGKQVTIVDVAPDVVDWIRQNGVTIESPDGSVRVPVPATTDPYSVGPVGLAFVFVKGYHTARAADTVATLLAPDTVAVTLQNGWGNADVLASVLPAERLLMGVTYHSCSAAGPGRVRHTGRGPTVVGSYVPDSDLGNARIAADFLSAAGWDAEVSAQVSTEIWKKLVLNAATLPTAALSGLTAGGVADCPTLLELVDGLALEAVAVARARDLEVDPTERLERIHAVLVGAGSGKPSMLQDVEARRKTEIESINGAVVRLGAELGVDVPLNKAMVALINGVERSWGS
jgi:2-dehydropantoate 2-reductase